MLSSIGFGWATRVIGFVGLVTLAIAGLLSRPMDQLRKPARQFFDTSAPRELPFGMLMVSAFLTYNAWLIPYFLCPAFSLSIGADSDLSFYLLAVMNTAQFVGRVIPAYLSDIIGAEWMLMVSSAAVGVLALSWISISTLGGWIEFEIFYGFISGMVATLPPLVVPYLCPNLAVIGTRLGMVYGCAGLGILIGNPVALALSDIEHGDFLGAQLWMGILALVGAATTLVFTIPASKLRQVAQRTQKGGASFMTDVVALKKRFWRLPTFMKGLEKEEAVRAIEPIFI
jgi:MFS family permease